MKEELEIRILLAEDDPNLGAFLKSYLTTKGYNTTLFTNGHDAYLAFLTGEYNFCITDVMMPVKDGFLLARDIRKRSLKIPILFLSAKNLEADKLRGFQMGADDYISKPFSMEELLMRIEAIIRRTLRPQPEDIPTIFDLGGATFNHPKQLFIAGEEQIKLTAKESELLFILCANINNVVERKEALTKVWRDDNYFNARSMDVYITKIRKLLKTYTTASVVNIHGVGFKLITD